ncbi:MAG TPA: BadF/BadG/BcrA/BcrD ATPase family protein [Gemmatirosa sp.]|nr:BadF/BadG/BcrA/BcrD ATPase family protein [Gemmatirosa sp.]
MSRLAERLLVVGVDGGGSKTRAVVADATGRTLATFDGPGSAVRPGAVSRSAEVIAAVVLEVLRAVPAAPLDDPRAAPPAEAGAADAAPAGGSEEAEAEGAGAPPVPEERADTAPPTPPDAPADAPSAPAVPKVLVVGVAGVGREAEREALRQALVARELADDVIVLPDAQIALDDAFGEGPGVMLIAGTGSVAFARGPDGAFRRCGGWGPVIGDEGSGAWIGRRAVNVAAASADGREPDTALVDALLTAIEADDPAAMIPWAAQATPAQFAELAPVVLRVAANGDLRANTLLAMAVEELVLHVRTLARALFGDERAAIPLALSGGLLGPRAPLRKRVEQRLRAAVPGAQLRTDEVQPARGAVRHALRALGVEV